MPKTNRPLKVGILVHERAPLGLTFLIKDIFEICNYLLDFKQYDVEFFSYKKRTIKFDQASLPVHEARKNYDYVIVSPVHDMSEDLFKTWRKEMQLLRDLNKGGTTLAASCLGVMLLAGAGLLENQEATTHWAWEAFAKKNFPDVKWNLQKMLCTLPSILTAGGYLAHVDLILSIVARVNGKKISQELGRNLLAETVREKQSVYVTELVVNDDKGDQFSELEKWIERNLNREVLVSEMAKRSAMSLRNFQRRFIDSYGFPPKRLLQLKRVQRARSLLSNQKLSIEAIVEQVGMSDVSAFRRVFQREMGMTLAEYRRRMA